MNKKINRLHEKCLHIVYSDKTSSFEELLDKDGSVTIHTRNLQVLATEMYKVYRNLSPTIVAQIFRARLIFFLYLTSKLSITGLRVYPTLDREYGT